MSLTTGVGEAIGADNGLAVVSADDVVGRTDALRWQGGLLKNRVNSVVGECAIALSYNGVSQAVMMATPSDLEDFALGFSLTEGILESASQLYGVELRRHDAGIELAMHIAGQAFANLKNRRRQLSGKSGCGLCGIESLEQLAPRLPWLNDRFSVSHKAIQRALSSLPASQTLQAQTGAAHAAAWCDRSGELQFLREDVGRHNALDKLIGARSAASGGVDGFVLVTSRASYEMVVKTASAGIPILVAVSAPTTLAIDCARRAGMTLIGFARSGRHEIYSVAQRIRDEHP